MHASTAHPGQQVNFRRGLRNVAFARGEWDLVDPPPPEDCGQLIESHEGVAPELLEAGNHGARASGTVVGVPVLPVAWGCRWCRWRQ